MGKRLTEREKKFVQYYLQTGRGRTSAVNAGYSEKSASTTASRLLKNDKVKAFMNSLAKSQLTPEHGITKMGIVSMTCQIVTDKSIDANVRLKGLTLLSRLMGYFTTPMDVLLNLPEDEILNAINSAKEAIEVNAEIMSNGIKT